MSRSTALEAALRRARVGEIRLKERLADYTTLKVGGPCRALVRPPDLESLRRLIEVLGDVSVPYFPLGGGSNLLVSDDGFDGVVIATDALQEWETDPPAGLTVGAGVVTARVVKWAVRSGLSGMEGLTGVPGSIGGACVMNAGGRGGNISDCLEEAEVVTSPPEVHVVSVAAEALRLAYRSSALPAGSIIGRARLRLRLEDEKGAVKRAVDELLAHRMATQPVGSVR